MTIGEINQSCMRAGEILLRLRCVTTVDCETFSLTCSCRCTAGQSVATVVNAIREVFREQGDTWRTSPVPQEPTRLRMRVTAEATQQQLKALCRGNPRLHARRGWGLEPSHGGTGISTVSLSAGQCRHLCTSRPAWQRDVAESRLSVSYTHLTLPTKA